MIGDALFDCAESLDHYLANYRWPDEVDSRVRQLRDEIRSVQRWLDNGAVERLANVRPRAVASWLAANYGKYPPQHSPGRGPDRT